MALPPFSFTSFSTFPPPPPPPPPEAAAPPPPERPRPESPPPPEVQPPSAAKPPAPAAPVPAVQTPALPAIAIPVAVAKVEEPVAHSEQSLLLPGSVGLAPGGTQVESEARPVSSGDRSLFSDSPDERGMLPSGSTPVTVVHVPHSVPPPRRRFWSVLVGAILGAGAGLGVGYGHFAAQPEVYESQVRLRVAHEGSPPITADAAVSQAVLERAARKLDEAGALDGTSTATPAERVAFLASHVDSAPAPAMSGVRLVLTARGPKPATPQKYLLAVVEAYREEVASRPTPRPAPPVPVVPAVPSEESAQVAAEHKRLNQELLRVTTENLGVVRARVSDNRLALDQIRLDLRDVELALGRITATGPARADRLTTMKALGVTPDQAPPTAHSESSPPTELLLSLQLRKAELGKRLGPEHRDMVALDDQMEILKSRISKLDQAPKLPDELDRYRAKCEADRAKLQAKAAELTTVVDRDEKVLQAAAAIQAELDQLATRRPTTEQPKRVSPPSTTPVEESPASIEVLTPPDVGVQVAPVLSRSLIPGGLSGLLVGAGLGLLVSLVRGSGGSRSPVVIAPTRPTPTISRTVPPVAPTVPPVAPPAPTATVATVKPPAPTSRSSSTIPVRPSRVAKSKDDGPDLGLPVLGRIPSIQTDLPAERKTIEGLGRSLVCFHRPSGPEAEAFRATRRELATALQNRGHQVILVTSPGPGDGKSTVAANLAISLAQSGKRVILVDCDLAAPRVQELFRLNRLGDGLRSVMAAEADLRVAVRSCEVGNLFLFPAGRGPMDPLDIFTRPKFRELLAEFRSAYEYVILDSPPTTAGKQLTALADNAEGAVLVIGTGADLLSRSAKGLDDLLRAGVRALGAVTNAATPRAESAPEPTPTVVTQPNKG